MDYVKYVKDQIKTSLFLVVVLSFSFIASCNSKGSTIASLSSKYSGCFGSGEQKIVVYKTDSATIAKFKQNDKVEATVILNPSQLETFGKYIDSLKDFPDGCCCTSIVEYTAEFNGRKFKRMDNGCRWDGFDQLKNYLFPSE